MRIFGGRRPDQPFDELNPDLEMLTLEEQAHYLRVRKRRKWLALLVVAIVGSSVTFIGIRHAAFLRNLSLQRAEAIETSRSGNGDAGKAIQSLRIVTQRDPKDAEALAAYAALLQRTPQPNRQHLIDAIRVLDALLQIAPNRKDDRETLVRLLDLLGQSQMLLRSILPLLAEHPDDPRLLQLNTLHLLRQNLKPEAADAARRWATAAPESVQAHLTCLTILRDISGKEVETYLKKSLPEASESDSIKVARAIWLSETGHAQDSERLLADVLAKPNWNRNLSRYVIFLLDQLGRYDKSDALIESLSEVDRNSLATTLALRDVDRGNVPRAVSRLSEAALPEDLIHKASRLGVSSFVFAMAGDDVAAKNAREHLDSLPIEISGSWSAALRLLSNPSPDSEIVRSEMPMLAPSALADEGAVLTQVATAVCLSALGQDRTAEQRLTELMRLPVGWSLSANRLINLHSARRENVQAIEVARFAFTRSGNAIGPGIVLALTVGRSDPTPTLAKQNLDLLVEIQKAVPNEPNTLGLFVQELARAGDPSAATRLRDGLNQQLSDPARLIEWANVSQQFNLGLEEECLKKAEELGGVSPRLALAKALLLERRGNRSEAMKVLRDAQASHQGDAKAYETAIAEFLAHVRSPDAREAWSALASRYPGDLALQVKLIEFGFAQAPEDVRSIIARIRKIDPNNDIADFAEIRLLFQESADATAVDASMARLNQLIERKPEMFAARVLQIDMLERLGNPGKALERWESTFVAAPDEPSIVIGGLELLVRQRQFERANQVLEHAVQIEANLSHVQRFKLARAQLAMGQAEKALSRLESLNPLEREGELVLCEAKFRVGDSAGGEALLSNLLKTPDFQTLMFAASVADSQGQTEKAKELIEQARNLQSLRPGERDQIIDTLTQRGESEALTSILRSAQLSNSTLSHISARWIERGNVDVALGLLKDAAERSPDPLPLKRRIELEAQLRDLVSRKLQSVAAAVMEDPDSPNSRAMLVFAALPSSTGIREQQEALDLLADRTETSFIAQMFVAERYFAIRQFARAERAARIAATLSPTATRPLILAATASFEAGNHALCEQAIRDWRARLPSDDPRPDVLDARNLAARQGYGELLNRYGPIAKKPDSPVDVTLAVAEALCSRGRFDEAYGLVLPVIARESGASIAWLRRVSASLDPAGALKAVQFCKEAASQRGLPIERIEYASALSRIAQRNPDPQALSESGRLLNEIQSEVGQLSVDAVVRLLAARLDTGEPERAIELCRSALESNANSAVLWRGLAQAERAAGHWPRALEAAERAIAISDTNASAQETRATACAELGRSDDALAAAKRATEIDRFNPQWWLKLTELEEAAGHQDVAREKLAILDWYFRDTDAWPSEMRTQYNRLLRRLK